MMAASLACLRASALMALSSLYRSQVRLGSLVIVARLVMAHVVVPADVAALVLVQIRAIADGVIAEFSPASCIRVDAPAVFRLELLVSGERTIHR